jgi:rhodanese-related sulfurtransferase
MNNNINKIYILIFLLIPASLFSQIPDSLSFISLKPAQFSEELGIVNNPLLVDVREYFEYKRSRLKGAVNMPSSGSIDMPADTINRSRHLFLYCTSGFRSKKVAQKFADKGFIHVYSLDGGIKAWKEAGLRVDRKRLKKRS